MTAARIASLDPEVAARLRRRYPPPRVPRRVTVAILAVGTAIALAWLLWAAAVHAQPAVTGQVSRFTVVSDRQMAITVTVDRRDPAQPVRCRLIAQATDHTTVGEQLLDVPATTAALVDVTVDLVTVRRATSASVAECSLA